MTEFVEEGRQGFIFEMGDIEGIYKILNSALENPELLDQLANSHPGYPISKLEYTKSVATIYEELLISHDEQDSAQSH